jgi:uncharacterized lipoprotein YajG
MKFGMTHSLALVAASFVLASCATTSDNVAAEQPNPCLGVAPAVGTAIVRKEECGGGRKQTSIASPASGGVVYDKKLDRSGQSGR